MIKVLIVDDDRDLLEMVSLMLEANKMTVTALSEGQSFFSAIQRNRPDVVIMDIYLTDADGRHLCRELKDNDAISAIPILLYSAGHIAPASITEARADRFLQKPFEMSAMVGLIKELAPGK